MSTLFWCLIIGLGGVIWILIRISKQLEHLAERLYDIEERLGMHPDHDYPPLGYDNDKKQK